MSPLTTMSLGVGIVTALVSGMTHRPFCAFLLFFPLLAVGCVDPSNDLEFEDRLSENVNEENLLSLTYLENVNVTQADIEDGVTSTPIVLDTSDNHGDVVVTTRFVFDASPELNAIIYASVSEQFMLLVDVFEDGAEPVPFNYAYSNDTPIAERVIRMKDIVPFTDFTLDLRANMNYQITPVPKSLDLEKLKNHRAVIDFRKL